MKVTAFYVGSSLLAPLKQAEATINREYALNLEVAAHNFGSPLPDDVWEVIDSDLQASDIVFVIHVMDGENASRLVASLNKYKAQHRAVVVINCMPELMRRTRMGRLNIERLTRSGGETRDSGRAMRLFGTAGAWVGKQVKARRSNGNSKSHTQYLKLVDRLPGILKFVPSAGSLRDVKHYLNLFCYFLQPTPANIRAMLLYALKEYVPDDRLAKASVAAPPPESLPSVAIYHPDSPTLFESFDAYKEWYSQRAAAGPRSASDKESSNPLAPESTIGLLLMRPHVISKTTKHYDTLIKAIEAEGLSVVPALSTLMDNREAVAKFFVAEETSKVQSPKSNEGSKVQSPRSKVEGNQTDDGNHAKDQRPKAKDQKNATDNGQRTTDQPRVSQIVSLTGFSFVGGPAMNDSEAAAEFLQTLNRPYRSAVSLDTQTIEAWSTSQTGLNPVQAGMQVAIPEIDGATEPFIYGGIPGHGVEPVALEERCTRLARRLKRWNRLRTAKRSELKLALVLFCFPPNRGNIGTAADLDVFPSLFDTLQRLAADGYCVDSPVSPDELRERVIAGNSASFGTTANVAYRMTVDEYRSLCPYVQQIEEDWGPAPGRINSFGDEVLIQGVQLGNIFIGVQPTFGYEGDPMRLMMARSGAPHHGFMAFYTYLSQVLDVDAVVHVGTHGSLEFMPGKQVGMSADCWPDRLIGELPNIYLYSVNNPSEGSIAKRRSYAELISYLTPPIENAGLYRELATLKDLLMNYRNAQDESERERLFEVIEENAAILNFAQNAPMRQM